MHGTEWSSADVDGVTNLESIYLPRGCALSHWLGTSCVPFLIFLAHLFDPTLAVAPLVLWSYLAILYLSRTLTSHVPPSKPHLAILKCMQT